MRYCITITFATGQKDTYSVNELAHALVLFREKVLQHPKENIHLDYFAEVENVTTKSII